MSELGRKQIVALGTALALGTPALASCARFEEKYSNCITTYVNVVGVFAIRETIISSLDQAMTTDTGKSLPGGSQYSGATATAKDIENELVDQYKSAGIDVDLGETALVEKQPFKNSMIRYCVGKTEKINGSSIPDEPGSIHMGNRYCIMTADNYAQAMRDEPGRKQVEELCGGELALPKNLR